MGAVKGKNKVLTEAKDAGNGAEAELNTRLVSLADSCCVNEC